MAVSTTDTGSAANSNTAASEERRPHNPSHS